MKRRYRQAMLLAALLLAAVVGTAIAAARPAPLSPAAQQLVDAAFAGLQGRTLIDYHAHLAGLGTDSSGASVAPAFRSPWHPLSWFRFRSYLAAAGVSDEQNADSKYVAVLAARAREFPVPLRVCVFAFDNAYDTAGGVIPGGVPFYVPNDYALRVARENHDVFIPVVSVHPYRPDAVAELDRCAAEGARMVKWLPNVQNMDPADTRCLPFYRALVRNNMTLITHAGDEGAFGGDIRQDLGNPLRLRLALDAGCTVIVAHCAAEGDGDDFDSQPSPSVEGEGKGGSAGVAPEDAWVPNLDLFLRLLADKKYRGRLYGDISTLTQINRAGEALPKLLAHPELHDRLVNGSDYPLPGSDALYSAYYLAARGYLTWREAYLLEEIQDHNPLLYDIVLKRTLRDSRTGSRFGPVVFAARPGGASYAE